MNIYFSGIGGVGIGPLAQIAADAGYSVAGSDMTASLMTRELEARGIQVSIGQDGAFLKRYHETEPIDWFVHTAALSEDHPELQLARELGIRIGKRDELLAEIIRDKNLKLIAIAGTHGKTTTTGMMVWAMKQLGIPVSYSIGSTISFGASGLYDPESQYFVYECDEFDRNFLHFSPYLSLMTSIDYDHFDTYPTAGEYTAAFTQFMAQSDHVIIWKADCTDVTVPKASWMLSDEETIDVPLVGQHNRANATQVIKALEYLDLATYERAIEVVRTFPGTDRRFEKLADNLYSDYGHHPVEIAATLQLARELSEHVVLVYQPHQNIRQHEIRDQYTDCMVLAEHIYWLPTYLSREDPSLAVLTPTDLTQHLTNKDDVTIADLDDELWKSIETARSQGKLVLCMGAGSIDGWVRDKLKKRPLMTKVSRGRYA